jgi:hypothetical protein
MRLCVAETPLRRRRDVGERRIEERVAAGERKATSVGDTGESPLRRPNLLCVAGEIEEREE